MFRAVPYFELREMFLNGTYIGVNYMSNEKITVATVLKPQGIRGEIKVKVLCDDAEVLKSFKSVLIDGEEIPVLAVRAQGDTAYIMLKGVADRNAAELLRGKNLLVARENMPKLPEGRYYIADLTGCRVVTSAGEVLGEVTDVTPARTDIYTIKTASGETSFAAAEGVIEEVDVPARIITVNKKRFKISYTISRGATTVQNQWNGSEIDFTNPVKFVITAEDGITKKEYIVKIVKTNPTVETKIEIKKYKVNGNNQISYIGQKVKVSDFLKNVVVSSNLYVEVQTVTNGQEFIGTNTKINIKDKTSKALVRQYECLVYGDVNGDGKISTMDYTLIKNHIMDVKKITDKTMKLTADVNGDGKISTMDYTLIKNHIMDVKKLPLK